MDGPHRDGLARARSVADITNFMAAVGPIWSRTQGHPDVCVAVLDGPVDRAHPCFASAHLDLVATLVPPDADRGPASQHGTHVASVIFGQTGSPITGIAPGCRGLILPVFASGANGSILLCTQLDLARAILQAVELGAHVINISGGQLTPAGEPEPLLAKAIAACADRNVLVVAAAGNDGCECLHVPAALATVLSVGAMNARGEPLDISNWGESYRAQGILAPGQDIRGASPGDGIAVRSGTSFATPIASGVAALLLSTQVERGRKPDPHAIRDALIRSAIPCDPADAADVRRCLAGRINPAGALKLIMEGERRMTETTLIAATEAVAIAPAELSAAESELQTAVRGAGATVNAVKPGSLLESTAPAAGQQFVRPSAAMSVVPSDCGCGGGATCTCGTGQAKQLIYALGKLGYDFGTEARRDRFMQFIGGNPFDPAAMVNYLAQNPYEAESLIWTLNLDATPIYAIVPAGPYAYAAYDVLRKDYEGQLKSGVELVSIPGVLAGSVTLFSGQVVPAVVPAIRGMNSWSTKALVAHVLGARPSAKKDQEAYDHQAGGLSNFLNRIYYDLRNLGMTAPDRALNYSATNAFQATQVIISATQGQMELDSINVRKSPVCRPDSDCYDVEVAFFSPENENRSNQVFRFTVDVSDVIPVTIGEIRSWAKRA